jgi:hypothetical protein
VVARSRHRARFDVICDIVDFFVKWLGVTGAAVVRKKPKQTVAPDALNLPKLKTSEVLSRIEALEKYINDLEMIPSTRYRRTAVLLALLSKTLTVCRAICTLVEAGFESEAFGLSRTLVDLFLNVRYIANKDTEKRAVKYVDYHSRVHAVWGEINDKYFPDRKLPEPAFHQEAMRISKRFKSKHAWTGFGGQTKMMALEEDTVDLGDDGKPFKSEFDYEVIYFWASHYVHGTVIALEGHAMGPGEVFRVRAGKAKLNLGDHALFNVLAFTVRTFVCALRAMNEEQPKLLEEIQEQMKASARAWNNPAAQTADPK